MADPLAAAANGPRGHPREPDPRGSCWVPLWLAQAQAMAGEVDSARATFERAVAAMSDVGLLAEEVDPTAVEMIGNFPQVFSHVDLINAAWAIAQAEQDRGCDTAERQSAGGGQDAVVPGVRQRGGVGTPADPRRRSG